MNSTLSGNRSAWITPAGRSRGQCFSSAVELLGDQRRPGPAARSSARGRACVGQRVPAVEPTAHWRGVRAKSSPAACSSRQRLARPPRNGRASGRRSDRPVEKGDDRRAALRARRPRCRPFLSRTGCGQGMPRAARCSISPRKNGRSSAATRFSYSVRMKLPPVGLQIEIGILDALGDALEARERADVVAGEELRQSSRPKRRYRRPCYAHSAASGPRSARGSGKNMSPRSAATSRRSQRSARRRLDDSSTSTSGAEAPAVTPSVPTLANRVPVDVGGALQQHGVRTAVAPGDFVQALRVGGIGRANHDHGVDDGRDLAHRLLPVGGGVADVLLVRARRCSESAASGTRRSPRCPAPTAWSASHKRACRRRAA